MLGDWGAAEEALQDALEAALLRWPSEGVPDRPGAWLTTTARRKALDLMRGRKLRKTSNSADELQARTPTDWEAQLDSEIADDQLRAIFTCCHPALAPEVQTALTLATLGGLRTEEIASAFLVPASTMAQRLVRAKRKIREAGIPFEAPSELRRRERLPGVLHTVYLVFNEGYSASHGPRLLRRELCNDAIRLARLLAELMPEEADVHGLAALLLLQDSRREARETPDGRPIRLEDQNRARWDRSQITEGLGRLDQAIALRQPGPYQIQAAIAALHAQAASSKATDWSQISALYEGLQTWLPNPIIALNHAVAVAMDRGPKAGLRLLASLAQREELNDYHYYHAAQAELLGRAGRRAEAKRAYQRALSLAENDGEQRFLEERLAALGENEPDS
jgi:RNA polymerase sigma-70 factor, ECF subfamily